MSKEAERRIQRLEDAQGTHERPIGVWWPDEALGTVQSLGAPPMTEAEFEQRYPHGTMIRVRYAEPDERREDGDEHDDGIGQSIST